MEEASKERQAFENEYKKHLEVYNAAKEAKSIAEQQNIPEENMEKLKKALHELELKDEEFLRAKSELEKKERLTPWNVDTLSKETKTRTIINSVKKEAPRKLTEDEQMERMRKFREENKALIRKLGLIRKPEDSLAFLMEHPHLVDEDTANHLVLWCIDLAVEDKKSLMKHVAHQTIVMQFLLRLGQELDTDPRNCIRPFFAKFQAAEPLYQQAFQDELNGFIERVEQRAKARLDEAMKEAEAEEREKRLGPGGLDPVEVFESLPVELQQCFESKDTSMLKKILLGMEPKDAEYYMKRCVDSGMWVPGAGDGDDDAGAENEAEDEDEEDDVYDEPAAPAPSASVLDLD